MDGSVARPGVTLFHRRRRVCRRHEAGMTPREIAASLGLPRYTVLRDLRRLGIRARRVSAHEPPPPARAAPPGFAAAVVAELVRLTPAPASAPWLAIRLGAPENYRRALWRVQQALHRLAARGAVERVRRARVALWTVVEPTDKGV